MLKITTLKNLLFILFPAFLMLSCSSSDDRLFEIDNEIDYVIPGALNLVETHFFPVNNVPTLWDAYLDNNGFTEDQLGDILPVKATIVSKFGENLNFINQISVWMYDTNFDNGREIFYMDPVDFGSKTEIELFSNIAELSSLIKQGSVLLELRITLRNVVATSTDLRLSMNFAVFPIE